MSISDWNKYKENLSDLLFHQQDRWDQTLHWDQIDLLDPQDHLPHVAQAFQTPPMVTTQIMTVAPRKAKLIHG